MASFNEETAKKILTQVEFYFSDSNLPRDKFLRNEVTKSKDGLVSLRLVCSFSRMRNLLGLANNIKREDIPERIVEGVANLLRTSDFLKVSNDGKRIGRGKKLAKPEKVLKQVDRRTIAASPFEYSIKMEDVASFFSQYAKVNSVRLPHHIGDNRHFCGTALVEFSTEQETDDILRQKLVYAGADLVLIPKSDFDCQRGNMIKKLEKTVSSHKDTSHNEFHRGQVVKFTLKRIAREKVTNKDKAGTAEKLEGNDSNKESGDSLADKSCTSLCKESGEKVDNADQLVVPPLNDTGGVSSEVLKDVFERFGNVKHLEYAGGLKPGYVCFMDSETATKARAVVEFAGGLTVKHKYSVTLEAVNGEMEREVWKSLSSAEPKEERKEEEDDKKKKRKSECFETAQPPKKARKEKGSKKP